MRTPLLIGLAGLTLALGAADAQARARIRFGGIRVPASVPTRSVEPRAAPMPGLAARRDAAGVGPTYVLLPPPGSVPDAVREAAKPAVAAAAPTVATAAPVAAAASAAAGAPALAVAEARPWCRSGHVVGTGTGFCMIN